MTKFIMENTKLPTIDPLPKYIWNMDLSDTDIPVLSDAIYNKVDIILTDDKDFLEANLTNPLVFSPSMLYEYFNKD